MVIGSMRCRLAIDGSRSLKDKKRALKSLLTRARNTFNVAVAEVDDLELWTRAGIGVVCVSNDSGHAHSILEKVARMFDSCPQVILESYEIEIV